jgi:four helix bundle protein
MVVRISLFDSGVGGVMAQQNYQDLIVWQKAIELVAAVYSASKAFPREEIYGLTSQLRRAAVSVPSNIAEGQGRSTRGEFRQFLCQARGSLYEVQTQVHIAVRLGYLTQEDAKVLKDDIVAVAQLLNGLLRSLKEAKQKE